jgi:hypothetical protein
MFWDEHHMHLLVGIVSCFVLQPPFHHFSYDFSHLTLIQGLVIQTSFVFQTY